MDSHTNRAPVRLLLTSEGQDRGGPALLLGQGLDILDIRQSLSWCTHGVRLLTVLLPFWLS